MAAIEPLAREFCRRALEPLSAADGFDFIADLGAWMPMRTIGYLLGIDFSLIHRPTGPTNTRAEDELSLEEVRMLGNVLWGRLVDRRRSVRAQR